MRALWLALVMGLTLAGCAVTSHDVKSSSTPQVDIAQWQGRINVQVLGENPSSMSASFLLRGDANNGELDLYSPIGTTLGQLQWTPQWAQLIDGSKRQFFNSLADLTEKVTGTALPVGVIIGWLQGQTANSTDWQADLSALSQGSITARRINPEPEVKLRIKLDP